MKPLLNPLTEAQLQAVRKRAAGSWLFRGPHSSGRRLAALTLTAQLNCPAGGEDDCRVCRAVADGNHPHSILIEARTQSSGKGSIGIAQIHQLRQDLQLQQYYAAGTRVVAIDGAEMMTQEAQNGLLKLLEEPPMATLMVLVTTNEDELLPTIVSRCGVVSFAPLAETRLSRWLTERGTGAQQAGLLARLAGGLPGLAVRLAEDSALAERYQAADRLAQQIGTVSLFERLKLAAQLAEDSSRTELLLNYLASQTRQNIQTKGAPIKAKALDRYRRHRAANVNAKAALEGLMLEL